MIIINKIRKIVKIRFCKDTDLPDLKEVGKDEKIWKFYKLGGWTKAIDVVSWEEKDKTRSNYYDFVIIRFKI